MPSQNVNEDSAGSRNIVITGFGLFRDHQVNPSWEAIRDGRLKIDRPNINVITEQVDVSYEEVDRVVSTLWKQYNPLLVVHVGLAAHESAIRIEEVARHGPFIHDDVRKQAPHKDLRQYEGGDDGLEENVVKCGYICKPCSFDCSSTCFNIDRVCDMMNEAHDKGLLVLPSRKSKDAGLYVCEYIYQKSLKISSKSVFIHVPDTKSFKLEDIRAALKYAIELLVDEALAES